ncbi:N-acetylmuramoyl-L-alanine amidase [Leptospira sp. 85282-16]|uniref:N-acetylmuramoyl-L-alanine amidase n=1 Tax=Leptospira montravelensis TaxID=2484961 RepID=A0ABY2LYJ1_9LEPT|nr:MULTISPECIES: N-acetylmuramoyl-L-alanine amidase [Leptospira]MCT8332892.1 N-acetylmuramoyl-L-alanine amidase [Leptospira sp. 85282-16]TGK84075.1 N-acetylmuramoyl-L-alanine amidase [Leptospira montravelensis]TGL06084.1 N-acetylmuramoyl-L-alanine amidase [Leptospira montravelensis]
MTIVVFFSSIQLHKFLIILSLVLVSTLEAVPVFRIVVDPGHGGIAKDPKAQHGDKYDSVTQTYLETYKQGTEHHNVTERKVVLDLAKEVHKILKLTETEAGWKEFEVYLKLFSKKTDFQRVILESKLTRESSFDDDPSSEDPNAAYRLYDFPDPKTGVRRKGRLSKINELKPHLVLSLHLNPASKGQTGGMGAVLTPGYKTFSKLKKISDKKSSPNGFVNGPWSEWLIFQSGWSKLENAIADTWIYFHGYWSKKNGKDTDLSKFEGYRQNMVSWRYADDSNWEKQIGKPGPYATNHESFAETGKFWEREKGKKEEWRREGGKEGFGGDNHYVSKELMRFVQYGLPVQLKEKDSPYPELGPIQKPYISTYSLPTYINALCAFIEIGYVNRSRDMKYLTLNKKETAISLAVGIYSLFVGLDVKKNSKLPYQPKGKKVNWERYETYFDDVL